MSYNSWKIAAAAALASMAAAVAGCSGGSLIGSVDRGDPCRMDWVDSAEYSESHRFWRYDADPETVMACLDGNGRLAALRGADGATPLHMAALNSADPDVLGALVRHGADVGARNDGGETPLHWAVGGREDYVFDPAILDVLIGHGADVDARDGEGNTPLHLAALDKNPGLVEVLLRHGADVDARNSDGDTPLLLAAGRGRNRGVMALLIQHGADVDARGRDGGTPLQRAVQYGNSKALELREAMARHRPSPGDGAGGLRKGAQALNAGDYDAALKALLPLAERGDSRAQFMFGRMYEEGLGVDRSDKDAASWYRRAAGKGHAAAQYSLGGMHADGRGVPQDHLAAHVWFSLAMENGHGEAGEARRRTEDRLSAGQLEEAMRFARECIGSGYADCL